MYLAGPSIQLVCNMWGDRQALYNWGAILWQSRLFTTGVLCYQSLLTISFQRYLKRSHQSFQNEMWRAKKSSESLISPVIGKVTIFTSAVKLTVLCTMYLWWSASSGSGYLTGNVNTRASVAGGSWECCIANELCTRYALCCVFIIIYNKLFDPYHSV